MPEGMGMIYWKGGRAPAQKRPGRAIRCKSALAKPRLRAFRCYPSHCWRMTQGSEPPPQGFDDPNASLFLPMSTV